MAIEDESQTSVANTRKHRTCRDFLLWNQISTGETAESLPQWGDALMPRDAPSSYQVFVLHSAVRATDPASESHLMILGGVTRDSQNLSSCSSLVKIGTPLV